MTDNRPSTIDALSAAGKSFPPDPRFAAQANAQPDIYDVGLEEFWDREARERVHWSTPYTQVLDWQRPYASWFVGGRLNACYTCVDRHVEAGRGDKVAFHVESDSGEERYDVTYADLLGDVVKLANGLKTLGVGKGTAVGIYMQMVPQAVVAMLACARLGAPHTVIFGGFSGKSVAERVSDMGCTVVLTQDGGFRAGRVGPMKPELDTVEAQMPAVEHVVVLRRTGNDVTMRDGVDVWWHDLVDAQPGDPASCPPEEMDAEDLLYLLYTSGSTGKPKAIVHTTGGYLVGVATTHYYCFDVKPDTVYWCAADIGWVTGHSYIVYGPLANGVTSVLYEGVPNHPDRDVWWSIVERYKVTVLYTSPTAIRSHMKWGPSHAQKHDLTSLKVLGTVGEPINPEAWLWYREHVGGNRTPVVDTWWQTETGHIMIAPLPGVTTLKPGSATRPLPGVDAAILDDEGNVVPPGGGGNLVIRSPWPGMLRGLYQDPQRYADTYWSRYPDAYFAGDGARTDDDGDFWLLGRIDDVINVSGHRLSTAEIESALVGFGQVAEAAVIGRADPDTGQAIVAFVSLAGEAQGSDELVVELREHVAKEIGKLARPADIVFTPDLPKTRSGKIMRRLLKNIAEDEPVGDTTTLLDPGVVATMQEQMREARG